MDSCQHTDKPLYVTRAGLRCFDCVPQSEFDRYPGWAEREAAKRKKAEIARHNFHKEDNQ